MKRAFSFSTKVHNFVKLLFFLNLWSNSFKEFMTTPNKDINVYASTL